MTQDNDSASAPNAEVSSTKAATPAKKPRTPRPKKPAAPAAATLADAETKKPAAKKPRATAKPAAEKAASTPATTKAPATAKAATDASGTTRPAVKKPAATRGRKPTPPKTPAAAVPTEAAPAPKTTRPAIQPDAQPEAAPKSTPAAAEPQPTAPKASPAGQQKKKPATRGGARATSSATSPKVAAKPAARQEVVPVPAGPAPEAPPVREAALADISQAEDGSARSNQEGKPASRRSRRGGRRRNKNRTGAAAAENGALLPITDLAAESEAEPAAPTPALEAREESALPQDSPSGTTTEPAGDKPREARSRGRGRGKGADRGGGRDDTRTNGKARTVTAPPVTDDADDDGEDEGEDTGKASTGKRKMFISVLSGELVEVVLAEEGNVVEYYVEMQHQAKVKGNIYKGVVSNIDANLQAAFISYAGGVKNGFLQVDEVHPEYYLAHHEVLKGRKYPPIQKVLKPGQEILVQVVKEPAGTKGAFLTSYLSLPGRFLVLTPGREQIGVSRKVDSDEERSRLKSMLHGLTPGKDLGVIVRTVSEGANKTSLQRDLQFLKRLWKDVRAKGQSSPTPGLIYQELDLATRAVRDYLTDEVQEVWVDHPETAAQVTELATLLFPKKKNLVQLHQETGSTLFERFSLQRQLDQIHSREVPLPSGGRLAIDNTEALTAIDINSGRSSGKSNFEDMAYRTNIEAARAIPLQLRLRDIGGQVVVDFIEMRDRNHWKEVEKAVRNGMKGDRARFDVGKIGPFGLLEIVRQRLGSSAISISTEPCPCCKGTGIRRNMEWQSMQALREVNKFLRQAAANNQPSMTYETEAELAFYLLNAKRVMLRTLEENTGVAIIIRPVG